MAPEALRELAKGTAVLLATGCRPALLEMQPWYRSKQAAAIQDDYDTALEMMTRTANAHLDLGAETMERTPE